MDNWIGCMNEHFVTCTMTSLHKVALFLIVYWLQPELYSRWMPPLFYKGTTFENSFGKFSKTLKILSIMASMQRIEEHLTSLGKNGAYNEYAAASMKMTRNNVDKITMF